MDHTLRVDHHIDPVIWKSKEKMRLDDFQRLVGERGAVDGDLASHPPGRVPQRVFHGGCRQALGAPVTKRPARSGEHHSLHLRCWMSGDALEYRAVLAVDRDDFTGAGDAGLPDKISSDDQRLLVGKRHTLAAFECCERGIQSSRPADWVHKYVHSPPR